MENGSAADAPAAAKAGEDGQAVQENSQDVDQEEDDRSISAPPVLELTAKTLFSYRPPLEDIRCDDNYEQFYESAEDKSKLPQPLKTLELRKGLGEHPGELDSPSTRLDDSIIQQAVAVATTPGANPGNHAFLEASSEISSIFGIPQEEGAEQPASGEGAEAPSAWPRRTLEPVPDASSAAAEVSAPVPVRARPPRPPGGGGLWQPNKVGEIGGDLGRSAARSVSPHRVMRSPFEDSAWDSFAVSSVINDIRCKSAELLGGPEDPASGGGGGGGRRRFHPPTVVVPDGDPNLEDKIARKIQADETRRRSMEMAHEAFQRAPSKESTEEEEEDPEWESAQTMQNIPFDVDQLTMPASLSRGNSGRGFGGSGRNLVPQQPQSGCMLQPMSPGSGQTPETPMSFRMKQLGFATPEDMEWAQQNAAPQPQQPFQQPMQQPGQFPPAWGMMGQAGVAQPEGAQAMGMGMGGLPGMAGLPGMPGAMPRPPGVADLSAMSPERIQEAMMNMQPMEAAAYAQSVQQAFMYAQAMHMQQMLQAQSQLRNMDGSGVPAAPGMMGMMGMMGMPGAMSPSAMQNMSKMAGGSPGNSGGKSNRHERGRMHDGADKKNQIDVNKLASMDQVVGKVFVLSQDQLGCRFLQRQLEEGTQSSVNVIFNEVIDHIVILMTDPFGNYLCQKLLDYCNEEQRAAIVHRVAPHLVNISLNIHGTRAAQKLVERLAPDLNPTEAEIQAVVQSLGGGVIRLIQDLNGNHVVQRCLQKLEAEHNQFIYDAVAENCVQVASHRHGCCVFQRCVDFASARQKHQVVMQVVHQTVELVQDAFGNYVVQYVLEQVPSYRPNIVGIIAMSIIELSRQKFSSNVVEKCLQLASPEGQALMITQLSQKDQILGLLQDPYANYVIQRALQVASSPQLEMLLDAIRPHLPALRNTSYGRKIQSRVTKRCPGGIDNMLSAEEAIARQTKKGVPAPHLPGQLGSMTAEMAAMQLGGVSPEAFEDPGFAAAAEQAAAAAAGEEGAAGGGRKGANGGGKGGGGEGGGRGRKGKGNKGEGNKGEGGQGGEGGGGEAGRGKSKKR